MFTHNKFLALVVLDPVLSVTAASQMQPHLSSRWLFYDAVVATAVKNVNHLHLFSPPHLFSKSMSSWCSCLIFAFKWSLLLKSNEGAVSCALYCLKSVTKWFSCKIDHISSCLQSRRFPEDSRVGHQSSGRQNNQCLLSWGVSCLCYWRCCGSTAADLKKLRVFCQICVV